jgi:hypothetical protein
MKTQADLVRGWLRKADSDLTNAGLCIEREQARETAAQAWGAAMTIRDFVVERPPEEMRQG